MCVCVCVCGVCERKGGEKVGVEGGVGERKCNDFFYLFFILNTRVQLNELNAVYFKLLLRSQIRMSWDIYASVMWGGARLCDE